MDKKDNEYVKIVHPFKPIYDSSTKALILGSFPSVISRKNDFYFSNPHNRFWPIMEKVFLFKDDKTILGRTNFLISHHLGMYDVIYSCSIHQSEDASIKDVVPNDIKKIISESQIKTVFLLGKTAYDLYMKYFKDLKVESILLPSSSPANASWSLDKLVSRYISIKEKVDKEI